MRIAAISLGLYISPVETRMIRIRYGIDFDADSRLKEKQMFLNYGLHLGKYEGIL